MKSTSRQERQPLGSPLKSTTSQTSIAPKSIHSPAQHARMPQRSRFSKHEGGWTGMCKGDRMRGGQNRPIAAVPGGQGWAWSPSKGYSGGGVRVQSPHHNPGECKRGSSSISPPPQEPHHSPVAAVLAPPQRPVATAETLLQPPDHRTALPVSTGNQVAAQ